ncbi:uncharacterized protein LOC127129647 [Lathyrus oleraceus]|uniref:uncharacterized protein LOC127129647 n=1 Tax=Pisum sativum TaxID=3888 RepID=UPI0021CEF611|nr:uncharacterized protein LOC127129647 [Pisum sativum]
MSQHQTTSASKTTKSTQKVSAPSMDIHDDEILDVVPLSVIPCEALDLNHPMDASASACPNQGKFVASKTANASYSEKHDVANDVIYLEDDRYDEQEDNLLHHLKSSVVKRMKTRKGRSVAEMLSAKTAKKTIGVGLSKSWSKFEVKKRKVREVSKSGEDGVAKWKFVLHRRVVVERELGKDAIEVKEVMDLIKTAGLMKIVVGFSQCYEGLVKEFIVNIPEDNADKNSKEFCKVFVRGKCIIFSPTVINNFLGRRVEGPGELEATDNEACREITARQVKRWPIKKHLPAGKLTVKHAILHKIGAANWVPTNHTSIIANTLGRFIFPVGTKMNFDYAVKIPTKKASVEASPSVAKKLSTKVSQKPAIVQKRKGEEEQEKDHVPNEESGDESPELIPPPPQKKKLTKVSSQRSIVKSTRKDSASTPTTKLQSKDTESGRSSFNTEIPEEQVDVEKTPERILVETVPEEDNPASDPIRQTVADFDATVGETSEDDSPPHPGLDVATHGDDADMEARVEDDHEDEAAKDGDDQSKHTEVEQTLERNIPPAPGQTQGSGKSTGSTSFSREELENLKVKRPLEYLKLSETYVKEVAACDDNIQKWEKQIAAL